MRMTKDYAHLVHPGRGIGRSAPSNKGSRRRSMAKGLPVLIRSSVRPSSPGGSWRPSGKRL